MVCQKMCHENELITQIIHAEAGLSPGGVESIPRPQGGAPKVPLGCA